MTEHFNCTSKNTKKQPWLSSTLLLILSGWMWASCATIPSAELKILCPEQCYEYLPVIGEDREYAALFDCIEENDRTKHPCRTVRIIDILSEAFPACLVGYPPAIQQKRYMSPLIVAEQAAEKACQGISPEEAEKRARR